MFFVVSCFASVLSQEKHWDKTNKEITSLKVVISFVCLVPVHSLPSIMAVLYHVNDQLQRLKEAIVTFIIRTPPQSVITASVLRSRVEMYLSYVEAYLCLREAGEREKESTWTRGKMGRENCCLRKRKVLNKATSNKNCHQIHTYGILFLQYLIQVLSLVVYWSVTTKRLTRNIYMNMLL